MQHCMYRVSHMGLEFKASWGAEDVIVGLHQFLLVSIGLQTLCGPLQHLQARVFGRLHVLFSRQVGPQGSLQAGMVAKVTALSGINTHTHTHARRINQDGDACSDNQRRFLNLSREAYHWSKTKCYYQSVFTLTSMMSDRSWM